MALPETVVFRQETLPLKFFDIFRSMKRNGEYCDITIKFEDRTISAHRIILFAAFPRFRDKFGERGVRINRQEMTLEIQPSALESLIDFAYTCELEITNDNVEDLLSAAAYLKADEVKYTCSDFLLKRINPQNAMKRRELAENLGCSALAEGCQKFIREHFYQVSLTEEFLRASSSRIKELINTDELICREEEVLEAVINWTKQCPEERKTDLPELMACVRLTLIKPEDLKYLTDREELISTSLACQDVLDEAKNYYFLEERQNERSILVTRPRKRLRLDPEMNPTENVDSSPGICAISKHTSLSVQYMNFGVNEWKPLETVPFVVGTGTVVSSSGTIYFVDAECIRSRTLQSAKWSVNTRFPTNRTNTSAAVLENKLYICGGWDTTVLCFDLKKNEYNMVPHMLEKRLLPGVVALGRHLYVFGGHSGLSALQTGERYDPDNRIWTALSPMKVDRYGMGCCAVNGKIYVCGGKSVSHNKILNSAEVYDPLKNQWKCISPMKTQRIHLSLVSSGRNIYAVGGCGERLVALNSVEIYDPCTDDWKFGPNMDPTCEYVHAVAVGSLV